jgi:hypothetical protein
VLVFSALNDFCSKLSFLFVVKLLYILNMKIQYSKLGYEWRFVNIMKIRR